MEQTAETEATTESAAPPSTETAAVPEPQPEPETAAMVTAAGETETTVPVEQAAEEPVAETTPMTAETEVADVVETRTDQSGTEPRSMTAAIVPSPVKRERVERTTSIGSSLAAGVAEELDGAGGGGIEIHEPQPAAERPPLQPVAVKQEQDAEPPAPRRRERPVKRGASQLPEGVEVVVLSSGDEEPGANPGQ